MRPPLQFRPRPVDCEWLGGRYPLPRPFEDQGALVNGEVDLWLELPRGVIVAITMIDSREPIPFGASLQQTMTRPEEGSPRRPARIRVADEGLARMRSEIESPLTAMNEIENERRTKRESIYLFLSPDTTVLGRIFVSRDTLRIETTSEENAEAVWHRISEVCGTILEDNAKADVIRQAKEAHYRKWLDMPLPILGGKTPRAAARSAKSRKPLEEVLRVIEELESGQPPKERFAVGPLRRELGLAE